MINSLGDVSASFREKCTAIRVAQDEVLATYGMTTAVRRVLDEALEAAFGAGAIWGAKTLLQEVIKKEETNALSESQNERDDTD